MLTKQQKIEQILENIKNSKSQEEIDEKQLKFLINAQYILNDYTPSLIARNYEIALNSVKISYKSVDYVDFCNMNKRQVNTIINMALDKGYVLTENSSIYLRSNKKVALKTIKEKIKNIKYIEPNLLKKDDIFEGIVLNTPLESMYRTNDYIIKNQSINSFKKFEIVYKALNIDIYYAYPEHNNYKEQYAKLFYNIIHQKPTIKMLAAYFDYIAELNWQKYRNANSNEYKNIFGKILSHLKNINNQNQVKNFCFLDNMKSMLGDKSDILINAMEEYYQIYHSDIKDKINKLKPSIDTIFDLSAKYISKTKEQFKLKDKEENIEWLKEFFVLKQDISIIQNRIINYRLLSKIKELYLQCDPDFLNFIEELQKKYQKVTDREMMHKYIEEFIIYNTTSIRGVIRYPNRLYEYTQYKKISKLINRLNNGYIKYEDREVTEYHECIYFDGIKYNYNGLPFSDSEINELEQYQYQDLIYKHIRRDIMLKAKSLKIDKKIGKNELKKLSREIPFNDEYYEFDKKVLKKIKFKNLYDNCVIPYSMDSDTICQKYFTCANKILYENGLAWLIMLQTITKNGNHIFISSDLNVDNLRELVIGLPEIINLSESLNYQINNIEDLLLLNYIKNDSSKIDAAILGPKVLKELLLDSEIEFASDILIKAAILVSKMVARDKSTVPFIKGTNNQYKYSMYDFHDESILLSGIRTNACFAINDTDNDFLYYCTLDKNGFIIKIADLFDNFIARASGFRNGNCVFINQLRTIFDREGNYKGNSFKELQDIIEVFKMACQDIVRLSQDNPQEKDKIDYVFVTKSYALEKYPANVDEEVVNYIGEEPMDNKSDDWKLFLKKTKNYLTYANNEFNWFASDYGTYYIICMASSTNKEIYPSDLYFNDVDAIYERNREPIQIGNKNNKRIFRKISKTFGIHSKLYNKTYPDFNIPDDALLIIGDNWGIIYHNNQIINECVMDFDKKAQDEYNAIKNVIRESELNNTSIEKQLYKVYKKS